MSVWAGRNLVLGVSHTTGTLVLFVVRFGRRGEPHYIPIVRALPSLSGSAAAVA